MGLIAFWKKEVILPHHVWEWAIRELSLESPFLPKSNLTKLCDLSPVPFAVKTGYVQYT